MTIISHRHRFIFLKTRKTAGSAIQLFLAGFLGPDDLIAISKDVKTLRPDLRFLLKGTHRERDPGEGQPPLRLKQHSTAELARAVAGEAAWNGYFKFCVERNPWDRMLSLWKWRQQRLETAVSFDRFLDMVEAGSTDTLVLGASNRPIYTIGGQVVADRILRFENLAAELGEVFKRFGIPFDGGLPEAKVSATKTDASKVLSRAQIDRIAAIFAWEVDYFGYEAPSLPLLQDG